MADANHIAVLKQGARSWNAWRLQRLDAVPDLRRVKLEAAEKNFGRGAGGPVNFVGVLLTQADLSRAYLFQADFSGADLVEADLTGAILAHANFSKANLSDADLAGADLDHAVLRGANLTGANLSAAKNLTQDQLETALGDPTTRLPRHLQPPASWFTASAAMWEDPFANAADNMTSEDTDLYDIIGARRTDSFDTIQFIYRSKAKALHPDLNPGDKQAEAEFHRLTQAYAILRDPERRARYDRGEIGADGEETVTFHHLSAGDGDMRRLKRYAFASLVVFLSIAALFAGQFTGLWRPYLDWPQNDKVPPRQIALPKQPQPGDPLPERLKSQERISAPARILTPTEFDRPSAAALTAREEGTLQGDRSEPGEALAAVPMQPQAPGKSSERRAGPWLQPADDRGFQVTVPSPPFTDAAKLKAPRAFASRPYRCNPGDLQRAKLQFDNKLRLEILRCLARTQTRPAATPGRQAPNRFLTARP